MLSITQIEQLVAKRHSHYALAPEWAASRKDVEKLIEIVLHQVPSAFNSQPVRIVLLTGDNHKRHWQMLEDKLIAMMGEEAYQKNTRDKVHQAFMNGVGTVLFFDAPKTTRQLEEQFPPYANNFPTWAVQANGMHQYLVWVGLIEMGFGASLQHYIGMVDDEIKGAFAIPAEWQLIAQMPFGQPLSQPEKKEKLPLAETFISL